MEFACARGNVEQDNQIVQPAQVFPYERLQPVPEGNHTKSFNVFFPDILKIYIMSNDCGQ